MREVLRSARSRSHGWVTLATACNIYNKTRQRHDTRQRHTDGTWLVRPRASYVAFDPADGSVLGSHRSRDAGLHQRISEMADPLHFGYFGGLLTKLVWFAFGAVLSALSITGIMVYGTRIAGRHARHAAVRDAAGVAS